MSGRVVPGPDTPEIKFDEDEYAADMQQFMAGGETPEQPKDDGKDKDTVSALRELAKLKASGALSEEEFEASKQKLLNKL